ncbi:hypothetical protein ACN42_g9844 [Penicillium freii]|uniref:Uncharacterized protein n=1 Tax=Penicillium freii TaxID=48697 RepID=A0A101MB91_PENFR|nr:hypothetical protein ACN42_g9844 [Penicillium freii]
MNKGATTDQATRTIDEHLMGMGIRSMLFPGCFSCLFYYIQNLITYTRYEVEIESSLMTEEMIWIMSEQIGEIIAV